MSNTPNPLEIEHAIMALLNERGVGKSICPSEAARSIAGNDEKLWRLLMKPIRSAAVTMAIEGRVAILRKRKPVDPNNFKGVYRLALPAGISGEG